MKRDVAEKILEAAVEDLAAIEHERWSHWQRYMHEKATKNVDGSLVLPADLVSRWERQMSTPYAALREAEKQSDRDQVRLYLPVLIAALASQDI